MLNLRSLLLGMALAITATAGTTLDVRADTLKMPPQAPGHQGAAKMRPPAKQFSIKMPRRGMTMAQVEKEFGPPLKKLPQVGNPPHQPITRWIYKDYTVYFEYQYVIQSVLNTIPPKP